MSGDYDLIIIGGGMVGASLACALAGTGLEIAVVEASSWDSERQPSFDDRAIALAYGTRLILQGMGLWDALQPVAEPIRQIHVSDRGHLGCTRLHHAAQGVDALGYVVTGHEFGRVLQDTLRQAPGVTCFTTASLDSFQVDDPRTTVRIDTREGQRELRCRLLVAADGIGSPVRRQLNIPVREWRYGQTAVISNLVPGVESRGIAYERFTEEGPMALLPLTAGRYGLVWTVDDGDLEKVMQLDDQGFLDQVQRRFGYRLGRFRRAGARSSYPLRLVLANGQVSRRVALVGNAAHAVHPITGQGFNLGIRDVAVLADLLAEAAAKGEEIGSLDLLQRYADWRRNDQRSVALMTDGLVRLFTNPLLPVRLMRNLGLLALDLMPLPKRLLTRRFMGLSGRLPRLARGLGIG